MDRVRLPGICGAAVKLQPLLPVLLWLTTAPRPAAGQAGDVEEFARLRPQQVRDSIAVALRAGLDADRPAPGALQEALTLAAAYSRVWDDPFPLARVVWINALSPSARRLYLQADSLRRLGNGQLFKEGPRRARVSWRQASSLLEQIDDSIGIARLAGNIGAGFYEESRLDSASVYSHESLATAERLGDRLSAGNAATILGNIAWEGGDLRAAMDWNLQAARLHAAAGDYGGVAADHNSAGLIAEAINDLDLAGEHYRTALEIGERHDLGTRVGDYLLNLGGLATRRLEVEQAERYFERALALYRAADESANEALAHRNLGSLKAGISMYDAAIAEYREALALYQRLDDASGEIEIRRLLASVFVATGRLDEALEEITAAEELPRDAYGDFRPGAAVALVRGDIELTLNRGDAARASYDRAERLYRMVGDMVGLAQTAQGHAQLELVRGRYQEVIRRLEPVIAVQAAGRSRAWSYLLLGLARAGIDDSVSARTVLSMAHREFVAAADRAGAALALGAAAGIEGRLQRPRRALRLLEDAHALAAGIPAVQWWLHYQAGQALEQARDLDGAVAQHDSAIAIIEELADWVRFSDRRAMYLENKWEPYAALARLWARRGEPTRALAVSEELRARYLLDQLARKRTVASTEGALRARERQLSDSIADLTGRLLATDDARRGASPAGGTQIREELLAVQASYRELLDRMRDSEPDYVRALRGETASLDEIQRALQPGQLLLEYLVSDDQLWIFAVSEAGVTQTSVAVGRAALRAQIDFARWALESEPDRVELWRGALRGLDKVLIQPVRKAGLLVERETVIIVPHLELHYLPFEALIHDEGSGAAYFVEDHDIIYTPSASTWLRIRERPAQKRRGVLALAPLQAELPGTAREVEAIRTVWGSEADVHVGASANEATLVGARAARVVHLATRGVLNRHNPLFSYVELYPQSERDGRLEVHEVLHSNLSAELVVLSACQTALGSGSVGDVPSGDDWVGLVRAFLHAGADNVIATLWPVDDQRTAELVGMFYRRVAAGDSYWRALAQAKRVAIGRDDLAHPYYWAGFVLTGSPDG